MAVWFDKSNLRRPLRSSFYANILDTAVRCACGNIRNWNIARFHFVNRLLKQDQVICSAECMFFFMYVRRFWAYQDDIEDEAEMVPYKFYSKGVGPEKHKYLLKRLEVDLDFFVNKRNIIVLTLFDCYFTLKYFILYNLFIRLFI